MPQYQIFHDARGGRSLTQYYNDVGIAIGEALGDATLEFALNTFAPSYGAVETLAHVACEWPAHSQCHVSVDVDVFLR
jgi:hypothetical protein